MVQHHLLSAARLDKLAPQTVMQVVWCLCRYSRSFSTAPGTPAPPVCLRPSPFPALLPQNALQTGSLGGKKEITVISHNHNWVGQLPTYQCGNNLGDCALIWGYISNTTKTRKNAKSREAALMNTFYIKNSSNYYKMITQISDSPQLNAASWSFISLFWL